MVANLAVALRLTTSQEPALVDTIKTHRVSGTREVARAPGANPDGLV
jgi:hypothetical protein